MADDSVAVTGVAAASRAAGSVQGIAWAEHDLLAASFVTAL